MKNLLVAIVMALLLTNCGAGLQVVEPLEETPEPLLSCSVAQVEGGALISCPDGSEVFVADGTNGEDATFEGLFVGYIDPCGPTTAPGNSYKPDELIYVDRNGDFHAYFKNVGHVILIEGITYQTTDFQKCKFIISDGQLLEV